MPSQEEDQNPPLLSVKQTDDSFRISRWDIGGGCFLLFFLPAWTYGTVFVVSGALQTGEFLGAAVFLLSWLVLFGILIWNLFGRETLVFTDLEVIHERRAIVRFFQRTGLLSRIEQVEVLLPRQNEDPSSEHYGIKITSPELEIALRADLSKNGAAALCDRVRNWIESRTQAKLELPPPADSLVALNDQKPPSTVRRLMNTAGSVAVSTVVVIVGIVWNIAVISMLVQGARNGRWGMLGMVIPIFVLIGLFLGLCSVVIVLEGLKTAAKGIGRLFSCSQR